MSIRYDLPRGQFFDEEGRYVNPATVAEKLRQAESEAVKWMQEHYPVSMSRAAWFRYVEERRQMHSSEDTTQFVETPDDAYRRGWHDAMNQAHPPDTGGDTPI